MPTERVAVRAQHRCMAAHRVNPELLCPVHGANIASIQCPEGPRLQHKQQQHTLEPMCLCRMRILQLKKVLADCGHCP